MVNVCFGIRRKQWTLDYSLTENDIQQCTGNHVTHAYQNEK